MKEEIKNLLHRLLWSIMKDSQAELIIEAIQRDCLDKLIKEMTGH